MRHRNRIHVSGGTYYTVRRSEPPHLIFERLGDYQAFEELLPLALEATGMKLLGYCWMPDAIHLALRAGRRPVADLMRRLTRYCVRSLRGRSDRPIPPFAASFPTILLDPQAYLPQLIQYLHFLPVLAGVADTPEDHPYTSLAAYLGAKQRLRVHQNYLLPHLKAHGEPNPLSLRDVLLAHPSPATCAMFERCQQMTSPILGESGFISCLPPRIRERFSVRERTPSLDEVIDFVAHSHGIPRQEIVSPRRYHTLVVTRARIAWFASEFGIASLSETARRLGRDVSSLGRAISHHLRAAPELFTSEAFVELWPVAGAASGKQLEPPRARAQSPAPTMHLRA